MLLSAAHEPNQSDNKQRTEEGDQTNDIEREDHGYGGGLKQYLKQSQMRPVYNRWDQVHDKIHQHRKQVRHVVTHTQMVKVIRVPDLKG